MTAKKGKPGILEKGAVESLPNHGLIVVDDEVSMRALLRDFLKSQGYRVNCFVSGSAALEAMQAGQIPVAIVSHVRMQPMDGLSFLKNVKTHLPSVPVILYTGAATAKEKSEALGLGASHYLAKPFSLLTLKELLEQTQLQIRNK